MKFLLKPHANILDCIIFMIGIYYTLNYPDYFFFMGLFIFIGSMISGILQNKYINNGSK